MTAPLPTPRCLTRWTGGSVRVVDTIIAQVPEEHLDAQGHLTGLRLVDPFVGGGALFFALQPQRAILADACEPLIRAWRAVRDDVEGLIKLLTIETQKRWCQTEPSDWFEDTRDRLNAHLLGQEQLPPLEVAALFFALMRSGYSGLWRVNKDGAYNVGFDPSTGEKDLIRAAHLRACAALLQRPKGSGVYPVRQDFRLTLTHKGAGDLIYADSPFVGLPDPDAPPELFGPKLKPTYTGWTGQGWTERDTVDLWALLTAARDRGAFIIHQNHDAPPVRTWAASVGMEVVPLQVPRSISCDTETRGEASEVLVVGRPARAGLSALPVSARGSASLHPRIL